MTAPGAIEALVRLADQHDNTGELAHELRQAFQKAHTTSGEMRRIAAALRCAIADLDTDTKQGLQCDFCGRNQTEVNALVVAAGNAICNECTLTAVEAIQRNQKSKVLQLALRLVRIAAKMATRGVQGK